MSGLRSKLSLHQQSHCLYKPPPIKQFFWGDPADSQLRFQCIAECLWLQHGAREKDARISWWQKPEVCQCWGGDGDQTCRCPLIFPLFWYLWVIMRAFNRMLPVENFTRRWLGWMLFLDDVLNNFDGSIFRSDLLWYCWWKKSSHQLISTLSHYVQCFIHPRRLAGFLNHQEYYS